MKTRHIGMIMLAMLSAAVAVSPAPYAQITPFGGYWDNVARAAHQNDAALVRSLVAGDGNPNQTDEDGRTGLHYAAISGNLQIIAILIKASAKLDIKDKLGNTPLHMAADNNQVEAAKLLLDVGAPVDAENKNGMTPLMTAASRGNVDIVQALLNKGASVTKTDFTGRDAAGWAAESHRLEDGESLCFAVRGQHGYVEGGRDRRDVIAAAGEHDAVGYPQLRCLALELGPAASLADDQEIGLGA